MVMAVESREKISHPFFRDAVELLTWSQQLNKLILSRTMNPRALATPSCQGSVPTCTSHAVGKAVVELLHLKLFECNQEAVIASLINLKQTTFARQWPHVFNDVTLALQVWDSDDEESKDWTNIKIGVFQSDNKEPSEKKAASYL